MTTLDELREVIRLIEEEIPPPSYGSTTVEIGPDVGGVLVLNVWGADYQNVVIRLRQDQYGSLTPKEVCVLVLGEVRGFRL